MQGLLIYAFAAATLGGFDSPLGAVVGGLIVGVTQTLAGQYIDFFDGFELGSAFLLILIVLLVRPQGLFGRPVVTRV
jgi:branched-chain amino acid transport system permease protein